MGHTNEVVASSISMPFVVWRTLAHVKDMAKRDCATIASIVTLIATGWHSFFQT